MIIESGVIIFLGLLLLFLKAPKKVREFCLRHDLALDLICAITAYILHWGTFTGVMAAAVAGLMCSAFTSLAKWYYKWTEHGRPVADVSTEAKTYTIRIHKDGRIERK